MALYKRGRWNISPEELDQDVLDLQHDEIAAWLQSIAGALSAGDSEVAALDKSLEKTDNVVLAAATIHAIYGIEEGFSLSAALRSFGRSRLLLVDLIELGLASGKLDVVLRQAASKIRAESQETTTLPAELPISCVEEWLVFYSLAVMADAGYPVLKALGLMKDRFSRSSPVSRDLMWRVTKMYLLIRDSGYIRSEALDETGFSPAIVDGAREGERNGNLDVAFARWTGYEPTQCTA